MHIAITKILGEVLHYSYNNYLLTKSLISIIQVDIPYVIHKFTETHILMSNICPLVVVCCESVSFGIPAYHNTMIIRRKINLQ